MSVWEPVFETKRGKSEKELSCPLIWCWWNGIGVGGGFIVIKYSQNMKTEISQHTEDLCLKDICQGQGQPEKTSDQVDYKVWGKKIAEVTINQLLRGTKPTSVIHSKAFLQSSVLPLPLLKQKGQHHLTDLTVLRDP